MKRFLPVLLLAAGLGLVGASAAVAECASFTISTTGVAFGIYDPLVPVGTSTSGSIEISCSGDLGLEAAYTISLSRGQASNFQPRSMSYAAIPLAYNLFADPARALIWGDGTGGTHQVSDLVTLLHTTEYREYSVFGLIYAQQQVASGTYSDSIVITVSF